MNPTRNNKSHIRNLNIAVNTTQNILVENNVEARTILAFTVGETALAKLLPAGWESTPSQSGPSKGANLNVIFSERLLVENLVQSLGGQPATDRSANHLAVLAVPALQLETGARGVMIVFGLSGSKAGAPGPYGVFSPAEASVKRVLTGSYEESHYEFEERSFARYTHEEWIFAGDNQERLNLTLRYTRGVPTRSEVETRAFSALDPDFYRTYYADQAADVLLGDGSTTVDDVQFSVGGAQLIDLFAGVDLRRPVSVISQPWTVRRVTVPPHVAALHLQSSDPAVYTKPYLVRERTLWIDSPIRTRGNGLLMKDQMVWLDKDLTQGMHGMCKVKLEDDKLSYVAESANLAKV